MFEWLFDHDRDDPAGDKRIDGIFGIANWFLISGGRRQVAFILFSGVIAVLIALNVIWPFEFRDLLTEQQTVQSLFLTLLSGIILLISVVVSINSLTVSQELTPIGNQQDRIRNSWDFKDETADIVGDDAAPSEPDEFLRRITTAIITDLEELTASGEGDLVEADTEVREYAEDAIDYLQQLEEFLEGQGYGSLDTRLFGPQCDPTSHLEEARRLSRRLETSEHVGKTLEEVVVAFKYFITSREYFKTIYYKREFSRLSHDLLYTGIPSILVITYVVLAINADVFPGSTATISNLVLFLSFAYGVALLPFFILTSYILRAAVIAEETVTAGAFNVE